MDEALRKKLLIAQKNEMSEYFVYKRLAASVKEKHNKDILNKIATDEFKHYSIWKKYTKVEVKPSSWQITKNYLFSKVFGLTFGLKFMERGEQKAQLNYDMIAKVVPEAKKVMQDEHEHETKLINLLDEELLQYISSIVLGLNDALVELTGVLAGLTLALQNSQLIAIAGLVTGIAAALSMATSQYLSKKSEEGANNPIKASVYTGIAYLFAVILLIFPYLILKNLYIALGWTIINAIIIIFFFTFYISVAKDYSFRKRFLEMIAISLGVALLSFGMGLIIRIFFGVQV